MVSEKPAKGRAKKKKMSKITLTLSFRLLRTSPNLEDLPCELVAGEGSIHEELLGLKFRVSPHSFFQVRKIYPIDVKKRVFQLIYSLIPIFASVNCVSVLPGR